MDDRMAAKTVGDPDGISSMQLGRNPTRLLESFGVMQFAIAVRSYVRLHTDRHDVSSPN
jgi:hypothetical protein